MTDRFSGPGVHVAIVNYFTSGYLKVLVRQLIEDGARSVTVLDNSVDDAEWGRLSEIAEGVERLTLIRSPRNVGFGSGHNAILRYLCAIDDDAVLCVLNPDTRIERGCLRELAHAIDSISGDCVVSPVIVTGDRVAPVVWFAGGDIELRRGVVSHSGYGQVPPPFETDAYTTGFLSGAVLATTLRLWRAEAFDDGLFLYWEDVDLALRWKSRGVSLVVQPHARVWHEEGGSQTDFGERRSAVYHRYMNRNRIVVLAPHVGLASLLVGAGAKRTVGQLLRPLRERRLRGGIAELRAAIAGLLDGTREAAVKKVARWTIGRSCRYDDGLREHDGERAVTTVAVFAPTARGGHPEYVLNALTGVLDTDDDIRFVWPRRADLDVRFVSERINQPVAIPKQIPRSDLGSTWRWVWERSRPWRRHDVAFSRFLMRARDVDVVLLEEIQRFTLPFIVVLSKLLGKRVIVRLHNIRRHDYSASRLDVVDEWITGKGLQLADSVLVHTEGNSRVASERYRVRHLSVVPHGISSSSLTGVRRSGPPTYLLFGEIRANKGVEVLVDAFTQYVGECSLTIAGRAGHPTREAIEAGVARDCRIEWIDGFVEHDRVPDLMARTNAVVLPYTDFEAQSGVLHLAIEHGVPVIVSDVGGLGETVRSLGIGLVVPPRNHVALAQALTEMDDPAVNRGFRCAAVGARQSLDWRRIGPVLSSILRG
ncbi:glycosyltransferase [Gordonia sp. SL306]|nr:glycosyltransferase [Gordonia sp. SL306]